MCSVLCERVCVCVFFFLLFLFTLSFRIMLTWPRCRLRSRNQKDKIICMKKKQNSQGNGMTEELAGSCMDKQTARQAVRQTGRQADIKKYLSKTLFIIFNAWLGLPDFFFFFWHVSRLNDVDINAWGRGQRSVGGREGREVYRIKLPCMKWILAV